LLTLLLLANLSPIQCPDWLPGTNVILPPGTYLTREQKVANLLRCYCEVVKAEEALCKESYRDEDCRRRSSKWIKENIMPLMIPQRLVSPPVRIISIEP